MSKKQLYHVMTDRVIISAFQNIIVHFVKLKGEAYSEGHSSCLIWLQIVVVVNKRRHVKTKIFFFHPKSIVYYRFDMKGKTKKE